MPNDATNLSLVPAAHERAAADFAPSEEIVHGTLVQLAMCKPDAFGVRVRLVHRILRRLLPARNNGGA